MKWLELVLAGIALAWLMLYLVCVVVFPGRRTPQAQLQQNRHNASEKDVTVENNVASQV